jgi:hypothetical protein
MDREPLYRGNLTMDMEFKKAPDRLGSSDITATDILLDLINIHLDFNSRAISALVDVFVNIFDGTDRAADLNVDMGAIFPRQVWICIATTPIGDQSSFLLLTIPITIRLHFPKWLYSLARSLQIP